MELGLGRAGTNGPPGDEVGDVLRRDRVEELRADGYTEVGQVAEQLPGGAETFVDFEGTVNVRVVDQTLPSYCRAGFLVLR